MQVDYKWIEYWNVPPQMIRTLTKIQRSGGNTRDLSSKDSDQLSSCGGPQRLKTFGLCKSTENYLWTGRNFYGKLCK
jgi:hypothetical protein